MKAPKEKPTTFKLKFPSHIDENLFKTMEDLDTIWARMVNTSLDVDVHGKELELFTEAIDQIVLCKKAIHEIQVHRS